MELIRPLLDALGSADDVREWSLYATESRRLGLGVKDREVGNPHVPPTLSEGAGARYLIVWSDGRISRGSLERRQLQGEPRAALEHARDAAYDDPDAAQVSGPAAVPEVELYDGATAACAGGDAALLASRLNAVRRRMDEHGPRTWSASFSAGEGRSRLVTSAGFEAEGRSTTIGWHVTVNGAIGDGYGSRALESADLFEARLARLMTLVGELARPSRPMQPGLHPVLLHPRVVEEYALGALLHNLGGSVVANGEGHFRRDEFGADRPVLRDDLGLRIDPLQPLKNGSYRFSMEGVPAARCAFIERGRVVQPILDMKYAKRLALQPTPVPFGMDTLTFDGASRLTLDEALCVAGGGALVLSVLGVHTQDNVSGDFSLSAPQALRIDDGAFAGHLRGTISGNLFSILQSEALKFVEFEGETTPGLLVQCRLDPGT